MENLKKIGWFFAYWICTTAGLFGVLYISEFLANNLGVSLELVVKNIGGAAFLIGFVVALYLSDHTKDKTP